MEPLFLESLERVPAENPFAERFAEWKAQDVPIPQILFLFAFKPGATEHLSRFTQEAMRGPSPLSPGQRELIAAFTSRRNQCPFWIGAHAAGAAELLGNRELVEAVLKDYRTAPISDAEKELFAFLEKVNRESYRLRAADLEPLRAAGWSEEAIYDAITVCALFNFYNRWCDAAGVHDMSGAAYDMMGKRMAAHGYATSLPPGAG